MAAKHRDPTPEEIAEECFKIRVEGFDTMYQGRPIHRGPWTKKRLAENERYEPVTIQMVSPQDIGIDKPCKGYSLASILPDSMPDGDWIEMRKRRKRAKEGEETKGE